MIDIKSYVIGFLTCVCMFLIMGQTQGDNQIGRYTSTGDNIAAIYTLDTLTGEVYQEKWDMHGWRSYKK